MIRHSGRELPWLRWFRGGFRLTMVGDAVVQLGADAWWLLVAVVCVAGSLWWTAKRWWLAAVAAFFAVPT